MQESISNYLASLSDADLIEKLKVAVRDLEAISDQDLNTPWHEACFAGACTYAQEVTKRGLRVKK